MKKILIACALYSGLSWPAMAEGVTELKRFISETQSLRADFTQTVTGRETQVSQGRLELSRPGKFRWMYDKPYPQLIVGDGKTLWIYDPDLAQVTRRQLDQALGSSPAALLAGRNEIERNYKLRNLGQADNLEWLEATPKNKEGSFQAIRMGFRNGDLVRMVLADSFNQTTVLDFYRLEKNPRMSTDHFRFTPPVGTDVIGE